MKLIPILFSTEMVQAILAGRKTQTRRVLKQAIGWGAVWKPTQVKEKYRDGIPRYEMRVGGQYSRPSFKCPYGQVGDVLWVMETWAKGHDKFHYAASVCNPKYDKPDSGWKPSIHMPFEAARIFLQITNIRVERLQDISENDAIAEGVERIADYGTTGYKLYTEPDAAYSDIDAKWSFESLWTSINGYESWGANPWVWVIEFKRVDKPKLKRG